jgi:hypothetical protein
MRNSAKQKKFNNAIRHLHMANNILSEMKGAKGSCENTRLNMYWHSIENIIDKMFDDDMNSYERDFDL